MLIQSSAPGKVILFGEHAVVYGQPAIAAPVSQVRAIATLTPAAPGHGLVILAADMGREIRLVSAAPDEPLALAARLTLTHLSAPEPDALLTLESSIPIAGGMGSGAAVAAALVRALAAFLGRALDPAEVSALVYEVEKVHHGSPSGIDNTVIAYEQPVYFIRGEPIRRLRVGVPFHLLVADSGVRSSTKEVVADVRRAWERATARYNALFDEIGAIAANARRAIEGGEIGALGPLMDRNHQLLAEMGVSSPELDRLVAAARSAGALGAKLSGAGRGGNVIALVEEKTAGGVAESLRSAGAGRVIHTRVE